MARGAKEAGRKFFDGGLGTFVVLPALKGDDHRDPEASKVMPFAIGDIDPDGDFAHVFDDVSLDIVIREFDTISDLTGYLDKRAAFIRSGRLLTCAWRRGSPGLLCNPDQRGGRSLLHSA